MPPLCGSFGAVVCCYFAACVRIFLVHENISFCIGLHPFSLNLIFYEGACGSFSCELYEMLTQLCKSLLSKNILSSSAMV